MAPPDVGRGWRVVGVAFVVAVFGWGAGFYGPAIYLAALHRSRGWPIAAVSLAVTAHFLVSAALITLLPAAYRRFGLSSVTIVGALCTAGGAVAWTNAEQIWQLLPALLMSGAGWSAMSGAALNAIVAPWFDRDRPKAISMAFNGASVGGVLFAPLWTALTQIGGLAQAGLVIGGTTIAVVCPLVWCVLRPGATAEHKEVEPPSPRRTLIRQANFLTMSAAFALGLFAQIGLFAHLIARLEPAFGAGLAAMGVSLTTLCAVLGRTLLGWLLGERDRRRVASTNLLMQAVGSSLLAFGDGMPILVLGCVLFGLGVGNLVSLPPLIAQQEFRRADVGSVVALMTAINQAVFAFAPAIFGGLRDLGGSYIAAFVAAASVQMVAAVIVMRGRRNS